MNVAIQTLDKLSEQGEISCFENKAEQDEISCCENKVEQGEISFLIVILFAYNIGNELG